MTDIALPMLPLDCELSMNGCPVANRNGCSFDGCNHQARLRIGKAKEECHEEYQCIRQDVPIGTNGKEAVTTSAIQYQC